MPTLAEQALRMCDHCDKQNVDTEVFRTVYGNMLVLCTPCYAAAEDRKRAILQPKPDGE